MTWLVKSCKHEDLSLMPRTHIKSWWHVLIIPALGNWSHQDLWDSLTGQPSLLGKPQVPVRDPVTQTKLSAAVRKTAKGWPLDSTHILFIHMHVDSLSFYKHIHIHTYISSINAELYVLVFLWLQNSIKGDLLLRNCFLNPDDIQLWDHWSRYVILSAGSLFECYPVFSKDQHKPKVRNPEIKKCIESQVWWHMPRILPLSTSR